MLWRSKSNRPAISDEARRLHAQLLAKHAHKYPQGIPHWYSSLLLASAQRLTLYPYYRTSEHGARMMRQRMAKAAHKAQRDKGIVPGQAGRDALKRKHAEKKALAAGQTRTELRTGSSNLDGI